MPYLLKLEYPGLDLTIPVEANYIGCAYIKDRFGFGYLIPFSQELTIPYDLKTIKYESDLQRLSGTRADAILTDRKGYLLFCGTSVIKDARNEGKLTFSLVGIKGKSACRYVQHLDVTKTK